MNLKLSVEIIVCVVTSHSIVNTGKRSPPKPMYQHYISETKPFYTYCDTSLPSLYKWTIFYRIHIWVSIFTYYKQKWIPHQGGQK